MTKNERDEAIRVIKSECYISNLLNLDRTRMVNTALDMAVEALKQTRWIPVSEGLPEDREYVLLDFERNAYVDDHDWPIRKRDIGVGYQFDGFWHVDGCNIVKGIAWMPLPEPYKAESEDKE